MNSLSEFDVIRTYLDLNIAITYQNERNREEKVRGALSDIFYHHNLRIKFDSSEGFQSDWSIIRRRYERLLKRYKTWQKKPKRKKKPLCDVFDHSVSFYSIGEFPEFCQPFPAR